MMSRTEIVSRGKSAFVDGFELFDVKLLNDIMLRVAMGGRGDKAPLLMVHGHPHTHVIIAAPSTATVATGIPVGIITVARRASIPSS